MGYPSFFERIKLSRGLKDKTFVIQGFGNVGYWAAKFFRQDGGIITTIVEYNSAIHSSKGFDPDDAKQYFTEKGTFEGYSEAETIELKNPNSYMEK